MKSGSTPGTTVVILGATGFIGRNLVERFVSDGRYAVRAVHHTRAPYPTDGPVEWVRADLTKNEDVRRVVDGADILIQAAAATSGAGDIVLRPHIHTTDNAVMNSLIVRAAHEFGVKHFLFFSCSIIYQPSETPVRETDFDAGKDFFPQYFPAGWTKLYIENMCRFLARISDTKVTVIRHSNVYGPHDKFDLERSHVFGATVTKVLTAEDGGSLTVWGPGTEGRDLMHVSDLVDFVEAAIAGQNAPFGLYNAGAGHTVRLVDLIQKIIDASGKDIRIDHDLTRPTIPFTVALDCGLAQHDLGWMPQTGLDDGIAHTLAWRRADLERGVQQ